MEVTHPDDYKDVMQRKKGGVLGRLKTCYRTTRNKAIKIQNEGPLGVIVPVNAGAPGKWSAYYAGGWTC